MNTKPFPRSFTRRRLLLAALSLPVLSIADAADKYRKISWDDLVPKDWDPSKSFQDLQHLGDLPDSDARVQEMYDRMREVWDNAPIVPAMAGRTVKLPGYLVPLETDKGGMREFLLVPYFGACIHTPPPPANQIVHVRSASPIKGLQTMDAVWVSGRLELKRSDSSMGVSGYSMIASKVEKYKP
jgi:hypothetical protein